MSVCAVFSACADVCRGVVPSVRGAHDLVAYGTQAQIQIPMSKGSNLQMMGEFGGAHMYIGLGSLSYVRFGNRKVTTSG